MIQLAIILAAIAIAIAAIRHGSPERVRRRRNRANRLPLPGDRVWRRP